MVGNGNHPLDPSHVDEVTLEEYVLGQLLPNQEEAVRQHLAHCAHCRAKLADYRAFCRQLATDLNRELESAEPGPQLDFGRISAQWRKPRRQFNFRYRLQQIAPSTPLVFVAVLLIMAFMLLFSANDTAALRRLGLAEDYSGPPAMVAATTDVGLTILRLDQGGAHIVTRLDYAREVRNLRFSATGAWVVFQEGRTLHVLETRADGAHARVSVHDRAEWAWSPDGALLAYTDGAGTLSVFDVSTQISRELVPAEEAAWGRPAWSADGGQIAYAVALPSPQNGERIERQSIWRVDSVSGYRVEIARNAQPEQALLVPTAWVNGTANLLAWDVNAVSIGIAPSLYWIDTAAHYVEPLDGQTLAQGLSLSWPVSSQNVTLITAQNQLFALNLTDRSRMLIADLVPWPQALDWAPNGAWMAYTVAGAVEGNGLFVFAIGDHDLRQIKLPAGATEKTVFWAGAEHLFVVRQPEGSSRSELWFVPLTSGEPPQRIIANMYLPQTELHNGWRWEDVVATQVLPVN